MSYIIKDSLPMMEVLNKNKAKAAKNHGIPLFRGVLYKHTGAIDQNLDKYGRPIFDYVSENTVVIGGAVLALKKLFYGGDMTNVNIGYEAPVLNDKYNVNSGESFSDADTKIALFGCGVGGSGMEWGSVIDPDFKMYSLGDPAADDTSMSIDGSHTWIPFRVSTSSSISPDENGNIPTNYFFRKSINLGTGANTGYAWYLKEFSNTVPIKSLWQDTMDPTTDGSEIVQELNAADMQRTDLIECFGECMLTITEDDLREFFIAAGNLERARFNQIGLFTGVKKQIEDNYFDYVGVRLFSVVNFNNVSVQEPSTNVYLYRIYSAV